MYRLSGGLASTALRAGLAARQARFYARRGDRNLRRELCVRVRVCARAREMWCAREWGAAQRQPVCCSLRKKTSAA